MPNIPNNPAAPVRQNQQQAPRMPTPTADGDTMERLFQALFYRIAVLYARTIPKHIRRLGETAILVMVENENLSKESVLQRFHFILGNSLYDFTDLSSCCI